VGRLRSALLVSQLPVVVLVLWALTGDAPLLIAVVVGELIGAPAAFAYALLARRERSSASGAASCVAGLAGGTVGLLAAAAFASLLTLGGAALAGGFEGGAGLAVLFFLVLIVLAIPAVAYGVWIGPRIIVRRAAIHARPEAGVRERAEDGG
jgi:hypothetical protein